ncbi:MAG: 2-haloalkanoic acid dehalogenase, partial [uncultured Solirubrobacteraceae bacterium]
GGHPYNARAHAASRKGHLGHVRRLRNADRLGDRHLPGLQAGGHEGRLLPRGQGSRPDHHALPPALPGGRGRVLRAVRRGAAPGRGEDRQGDRLGARALAGGVPARFRLALGTLQGDRPAAEEVLLQVLHGPRRQRRRQAARADAPPHPGRLRPRGHRPAGALLQAGPRALQRVRAPGRQQEGLGPHRLEPLPRCRAVREGQGARRLGQPAQGAARARSQEADRRGQEPPGGREAPRGV